MTDINIAKLAKIRQALNAKFYEREEEIEGILIAVLSRQHILMIGPAGTAKSALAMALSKVFHGTEYFQWLLTKFSTPEEVFGPLSLKELEQGIYRRNTAAKMPEAHLAFLDEVFKANSAILNSLLSIMNERLFHNHGAPYRVPLVSVIGASNEYPEEEDGLAALFDRFLLRFEVKRITDHKNFISMMKADHEEQEMPAMTMEELQQLQRVTEQVTIPAEIYEALIKIRTELEDEGIQPSDRRFKQSLHILRAKALVNQRDTVDTGDLAILEHTLWETPEQIEISKNIIHNHAQSTVIQTLSTIQEEAEEIYYAAIQDDSTETGIEATGKIKMLLTDLQELKANHQNRQTEIDVCIHNVTNMHHEVLNRFVEPWYESATPDKKRKASLFFKM